MAYIVAFQLVNDALDEAENAITLEIETGGDGAIDNGDFDWVSATTGIRIHALTNAQAQMTYSTLRRALVAISNYMDQEGHWGATYFHIYEESSEVGYGWIIGPH